MTETAIKRGILLDFGARPDLRLFNNPRGVAVYKAQGRTWRVDYGLTPGASDLIGWQVVTITPEMVGQRFARFVAIETKTEKGRPEDAQDRFLEAVRAAGGIGSIARSNEDVERALAGVPALR